MFARRLFLISTVALVMTGCGDFTLRNDDGRVALHPVDGYSEDTEVRELVAQVTDLNIEQTPSGVIVHVEGLPPRQGFWAGELIAENRGKPVDGVLTYAFRIAEPYEQTRQGTPHSRRVHVAQFVSNVKLREVRQIRILGEGNSLTARR